MIIATTTTKGGAGKTTITINLAVGFAKKGYDVCIVDADTGQYSALKWSEYREDDQAHIAVLQVPKEKLNREVKALEKRYDIVFIDGRPTHSEVGDRIVMASDVVIIPIMPSVFDLEAFQDYLPRFEQVKTLKNDIGGEVEAYALLNGLIVNSNLSNEIEEAVKEAVEGAGCVTLLNSKLKRRVVYSSSATSGLGVVEDADKKAKEEVEALVNELEQAFKNA